MAKKKQETPFGDFQLCVQCINHPINGGNCNKPVFPDDCGKTECKSYIFNSNLLKQD